VNKSKIQSQSPESKYELYKGSGNCLNSYFNKSNEKPVISLRPQVQTLTSTIRPSTVYSKQEPETRGYLNRREGKKSSAKLNEFIKIHKNLDKRIISTAHPSRTSRLKAFSGQYDKSVIETMNKLGYALKDVYEGLMSNDKQMLDTYNRMLEEKKRADEFKKFIYQ
jgi:hypothetical protein